MKQIIDIDNWKGKKHYEWFITYPQHYYNLTKQIDVTKLVNYLHNNKIIVNGKEEKVSFFVAMLYLVTKSLNSILEMRLRVENNQVVLYDTINPAYTVMTDNGVFDNCDNQYYDDFHIFYEETRHAIDKVKHFFNDKKSYNNLEQFNQYYITCLPWTDFTGLIHPMPDNESSFVPRICWGKFIEQNNKYMLSLNIQVSHALVDGYPLCQAFLEIEKNVNLPEQLQLK